MAKVNFKYMKLCLVGIVLFFMKLGFAQENASADILKKHLSEIITPDVYRNYKNTHELNRVSEYIKTEFAKVTESVRFQNYDVDGKTYRNVIGSIGVSNSIRIIVGAHYDVCGDQDGADDNGSGISGLLELARLFKDCDLKYRIDFLAYTLEEPPFFRTEHMGSYIHAKSLVDSKVDVYGMISLEMIGYFSNKPNSQAYPDPRLKALYGTKGDFITLVSKPKQKPFASNFANQFQKVSITKAVFFNNGATNGSDFSDHLNYWKFNISALMITDTAFLRNFNYHKSSDTIETLDFDKMASVVDDTYKAILQL